MKVEISIVLWLLPCNQFICQRQKNVWSLNYNNEKWDNVRLHRLWNNPTASPADEGADLINKAARVLTTSLSAGLSGRRRRRYYCEQWVLRRYLTSHSQQGCRQLLCSRVDEIFIKMLFRLSSSVVLQTFILDQHNQMQKKWFSDVLKINPFLGWKWVLNFYIIKTVSTILMKFVSGIGFGVLYQLCIFQLMFIIWKTYWIMVLRRFSVSSSFSYLFISA